MGTSAEVNCEIPLNRYSFFEELQDKLLPNVRIELQIEMENDKNLVWRGDGQADAAGTTYRLIVTRLQLYVPRMIFNSEGQKLYLENYLKPNKWTYLTETTYNQDMRTQRTGNFRLTNGILKPRHVFIFFSSTMLIWTTNFKILSFTILSLYLQIQEHLNNVIWKWGMEMNIHI